MEEKDSNYQEKGGLYGLLPAAYRQHEFDRPGDKRPKPMQELLGIIEEQAALLEADISQLYDNWFIETCQEWVVPYIGDLLGVSGVRPASKATFSPRAWIANTLAHRRHKGTLSMLEQLAHDVTDWNAKAVEFFPHLSSTQNVNHVRPDNSAFTMRSMDALDLVGTPFDTLARTADFRHIASRRGLYNIPNIGIFLWRLQSYHVYDSPAYDHGSGRFSFSQLGNDAPLFNHPATEERLTHATLETNVPGPIRRRALHENPRMYCGQGMSINIVKDGVTVDAADVMSCDLTGWKNAPKKGKVAVDPVLGRILFPTTEKPKEVRVSYYYGFSADVGGGSYLQRDSETKVDVYEVAKKAEITSIRQAISEWKKKPASAVLEITDSDVYEESIDEVELPAGVTLTIRAGEGKRPAIRLSKPLVLSSAAPLDDNSGVVLEGLLVHCPANKPTLVVKGTDLSSVRVEHCTLVPEREAGTARSIELDGVSDELTLRLHRTICGAIAAQNTRAALEAKDSIIDGKGERPAISIYRARIENCTVFGSTNVVLMELASNSIFSGPAIAERLQKGCARFCYVPAGSRLGRRYRCQPAEHTAGSEARPYFVSEHYGDPGYAQLHANSDREITEGADNGNEMGAFNHLLQRHRLANLEACLEEYLRFGMEAGVFLVT
jgi:hypothetical protein